MNDDLKMHNYHRPTTQRIETPKAIWRFKNFLKDQKYLSVFVLVVGLMLTYKLLFHFDAVTSVYDRFFGIISPFLLGFVIAYCINIPVSFFERLIDKLGQVPKYRNFCEKVSRLRQDYKNSRDNVSRLFYFALTCAMFVLLRVHKFARKIGIFITCFLLFILLFIGLRGLIPMIYDNAMRLIELMPRYIEQSLELIKGIPYFGQMGLHEILDPLMEARPWANFDLNLGGGLRFAQNFFSGVFFVVLTIISTIYFLIEYNKIKAFFHRLVAMISVEKKRKATIKYIRLIDGSFKKFLTGQSLDSLILATITSIQFFFLGSPYPLVLGLMLGVANIVPYFGSIFGSIFAVFITFFSNGWETALLTAFILLITQQFDGYFINPRIMGSQFSLSPILVIIAITIGGALGGVVGMIFAIPVANVFKTVMDEFIETREKRLQAAVAKN